MGLNFKEIFVWLTVTTNYLEEARIKVVDQHLIELFGHFKNSTKDIHLIFENACAMTASWTWLWSSFWHDDLLPCLSLQIELPKITKLRIIIIHSTKNVQLAFVIC